MTSDIVKFEQHLISQGFPVMSVNPDRKVHRFDIDGSKGAGWYIYFVNDSCSAAMFGDWRTGLTHTWNSAGKNSMAPTEFKRMKDEADRKRQEYLIKKNQKNQNASDEACEILKKAKPVQNHSYLVKKGAKSYGLKEVGGVLVVPLQDESGNTKSLQYIYGDGSKKFLNGGAISGNFYQIDRVHNEYFGNEKIYICEGYATGATIHEATGGQTIIAFNAGNLLPVAKKIREVNPNSHIVVCGDNDQWTNGNPGATKANEVGKIINASVAIPVFKDVSNKPTDFNDLFQQQGINAVYSQLVPTQDDTKESKQEYTVLSFTDILNKPAEFNPIINGMFNEGDNVVIHATGGVGKSLFTTYLSLFLASRDNLIIDNTWPKVFDKFPVSQERSTLFIQSENSHVALYQRIKKMCKGDSRLINGLNNIFIPEVDEEVCLFGKSFNDESFSSWLLGLILYIEKQNKKKIDILIIDPFISFHDCEENANREMREVLDKITKLSKQAQVTPIIVHHDNKDGGFRGASALHDWARSRIHLSHDKKAGEPCVKVTHEKSNNGPRFEDFHLQFDENLIFHEVDFTGQPTEADLKKIAIGKEVYKVLKKLGGHAETQKEIADLYEQVTGCSLATAKRHVTQAKNKGYIEEVWGADEAGKQKLTGFKLSSHDFF